VKKQPLVTYHPRLRRLLSGKSRAYSASTQLSNLQRRLHATTPLRHALYLLSVTTTLAPAVMVKISFKPKSAADSAPPTPLERTTPAERAGSLKLKINTPAADQTSASSYFPLQPLAPPPKPKRAYNKKIKEEDGGNAASPATAKGAKKRPRKNDQGDEPTGPAAKRPAPTRNPSITLKLGGSGPAKRAFGPKLKIPGSTIPKISFKQRTASASTPRLKVKSLGKLPHRPRGVGYDSEADDIELDPAIEHQFILRMEPGDDCDYLREAITASGLRPKGDGKSSSGPDFWMRFFDKEGRRGVVSVRGNLYAASLLDLPCLIEGMKSWDKRGFYKTADICQILLVLGRVKDEEEAKTMPLSSEVDEKNWQFPHGLTPPMHYVRKRRFRKRINIRTIERVENDVEELFKKDSEYYSADGGTVKYEWVDPDAEEMDGGNVIDGYEYEAQGNEEFETPSNVEMAGQEDAEGDVDGDGDDDEFTRMMEEGLAGNDGMYEEGSVNPDGNGLHASPDSLHPPGSALTPASGATSATEDGDSPDEESEDEADTPEVVDETEEDVARREEREAQQEEIDELKRSIVEAEEKAHKQVNTLLKKRFLHELESLKSELELKLTSMGLGEDD
jgi:transcription initiation factor TFIID subunit 7